MLEHREQFLERPRKAPNSEILNQEPQHPAYIFFKENNSYDEVEDFVVMILIILNVLNATADEFTDICLALVQVL